MSKEAGLFFKAKIVLWCFVISVSSLAHEVRPSYLQLIQETQNTYQVMWKVPAKGELRLGVYVNFTEEVEQLSEPIEYFSAGYYISIWTIRHQKTLIASKITFEGLTSTLTEVLVRVQRLDGTIQISRVLPDKPFFIVEKSPSVVDVMYSYTGLGIKHIWLGFDHLLFLICLLFIAKTGKKVVLTVTGFTLAHSLTLSLSALDIIHLAIAPIEVIIALSIMFLASELMKDKRDTLTWRYPGAISLLFGLLHGFGFAAVLKDIGLPQNELLTGLIFFNLGIEIGQITIIVIVLALVGLLKRSPYKVNPLTFTQLSSYAVGSVASFWLIERTANFFS
ncbi:HupE/UreJ family protein [Colwelliaceae bacterium MEBiC 14330]